MRGCAIRAAPSTSRPPIKTRSKPPERWRIWKELFPRSNPRMRSPKPCAVLRLVKINCSSSISPGAATKTRTFIARILRSSMSQTRIGRLFERLRTTERRPALITYITAGDPSPDRTPELVAALERGGADLIELGVPFSDPIADGPVIQRGSERALKAGTRVSTVLDIAAAIRKRSEIPLLLFTYM